RVSGQKPKTTPLDEPSGLALRDGRNGAWPAVAVDKLSDSFGSVAEAQRRSRRSLLPAQLSHPRACPERVLLPQSRPSPGPKIDRTLLLAVALQRSIRLLVQFSADKAPKRTLSPVFATQSGFIDIVRFKFPKIWDRRRQAKAI